jgi:centromeric protein E
MDVSQDRPRRSFSASSMGAISNAAAKKERVWVAVRIRPLLELEQLARERTAWKAVGSNNLQHVDPDKPAAQCPSYQYNRVFPDSSSSAQVYKEAAAGLVAASMQGYNSTIFAYGQTGSGKTYTMQAIMAAAAQDMFQAISQEPDREYIIRIAAVEIYNEVVRDLLRDNSPGLKLLDDPLKGTVAEGLSEAGVQSEQHLQQLLAEVEARRQVSGCSYMETHSTATAKHARLSTPAVHVPQDAQPCRGIHLQAPCGIARSCCQNKD